MVLILDSNTHQLFSLLKQEKLKKAQCVEKLGILTLLFSFDELSSTHTMETPVALGTFLYGKRELIALPLRHGCPLFSSK